MHVILVFMTYESKNNKVEFFRKTYLSFFFSDERKQVFLTK